MSRLRLLTGPRAPWDTHVIPRSLLYGRLDAEAAGRITVDGSNGVSAWVDGISGQSFSQATSSARPIYSATSFNGRPGITFDGVDDNLRNTGTQAWPLTGDYEIWMLVISIPATVSANQIFINWPTTATGKNTALRRNANSTNGVFLSGNGTTNAGPNIDAVVPGLPQVWRGIADGANIQTEIDGVGSTLTACVPSLDSSASRNTIGANSASTAAAFANVAINLIMVTRRLPDDLATKNRRYLLGRAGRA